MSAAIGAVVGGTGVAADDREAEVCAWLVARGRLKDTDLGRARRLHEESTEGTLTALMARLGLVSERDLAEAWAELLQVPLLAARDAPELPPADLELSLRFLKQQHVCRCMTSTAGWRCWSPTRPIRIRCRRWSWLPADRWRCAWACVRRSTG